MAILIDILVLKRQYIAGGWTGPGDFHIFRDGARAIFEHSSAVGELQYPPPFLLLISPFAVLPPNLGDILWVLTGVLVLGFVGMKLGLGLWQVMLGLISPPALYCVVMGQTGLFISSALLVALACADTAPVLAGIAAGCVVVKPQFAILLPVCFLAGRQWRAFVAAVATVLVLCLLPALVFGPWVWQLFLHKELKVAWADVSAPGAIQEHMMVTPFVFFRTLGVSDHLSGIIQVVISLSTIFACWRIWSLHRENKITAEYRLAVTACLIFLVTPFAYIYDLSVVAFSLLLYAARQRPGWAAAIAIFWSFTGLYGLISTIAWPAGATLVLATALAIRPWE
ncbi:MAG: DUF2029 domain-containing protein [Proteobacteria bacterium]|nr:DUF2029 domain-containing protein [Pseudomonadota bacterium]MBU6425177.1 DUF2029 domain-containing protein [Rhodospirillales bacterium]